MGATLIMTWGGVGWGMLALSCEPAHAIDNADHGVGWVGHANFHVNLHMPLVNATVMMGWGWCQAC